MTPERTATATATTMTTAPASGGPARNPRGAGDEVTAMRRDAAALPRLLVALAGACTLSGIVGFGWIAAGRGAPAMLVLLAPPALVVAAAVLRLGSMRVAQRRRSAGLR